MTTTITIIREVEITVEVRYLPGTRATYWQPGDPADVEIIEAQADGDRIDLWDSEIEEVRQMVLEDPPERDSSCF